MTTQRDETPETDLFFGALVHMNPAAVPSDEGPLHNFCGNLERDRNRLRGLRAQLAGVVKRCAKVCLDIIDTYGGEGGLGVRCYDAISALADLPAAPKVEPVYIIFDGPPSHESGRFIEVETADGKSVSVGEWKQNRVYWKLGPLYASTQAPDEKAGDDPYYKDAFIQLGYWPNEVLWKVWTQAIDTAREADKVCK